MQWLMSGSDGDGTSDGGAESKVDCLIETSAAGISGGVRSGCCMLKPTLDI